jgi:hypothetical protein
MQHAPPQRKCGCSIAGDLPMSTFRSGQHYFLLRYLDDACTVPTITTLVYLGDDIFPDAEAGKRWYFQDAQSFLRSGAVKPIEQIREAPMDAGDPESQVWEFPEEQLSEILTQQELVKQLTSSTASR